MNLTPRQQLALDVLRITDQLMGLGYKNAALAMTQVMLEMIKGPDVAIIKSEDGK